jgi:hypothetical protein
MVLGEAVLILYVQMDGTGIPVVKKETVGRQGKTEGEPSHSREVKLGCVFTQTAWDKDGYPIRNPDSTTYVGAIEPAEEFGKRLCVGSLEARLEPRGKEGGHGRWGGMDLEPCRALFSRCRGDLREA